QLLRFLPNENFIYLGDTARVPYGNKSQSTIEKYAGEATRFLLNKSVKLIVIACNTVSSIAMGAVKQNSNGIPVVGMIEFSARTALRLSKNHKIGIIGTRATIESKGYEKQIRKLSRAKNLTLISQPCPLFVPLVEEGFINTPATHYIAEQYLAPFKDPSVDTLILGCTHYPMLSKVISEILPNVILIDTGVESSIQVLRILAEKNLLKELDETTDVAENININNFNDPNVEFYLTDISLNFKSIAELLLGYNIKEPIEIDISDE
ncbi:MAG TPA: glutamate racemase, partial [Candidatus Kapabacteria bacterium]|nr:glutamate racemase [Candidatus Kapabacteria bacterium]